jgi:N-acetylglucosamine kinase-like BadF-type ATPase
LVAGIDGGQSSTTAVVLDEAGAILGRGVAGPSDHVDEPPASRRAADACETAIAGALREARLPATTPLAGVVVGLSGYDGSWHGVEPVFLAEHVRYVHDAPAALAGAIAARPAAVVIAGTGSVAYGEPRVGDPVRVGGFGYLFGDEGSSFAIARTAIAAAMRVSDRGILTDLGAAALAFFDCRSLRGLARAVSLKEIARPQIAAFARVVYDAARLGDEEAQGIIDDAVVALATLADAIVARLDGSETTPIPLAFVGGAMDAGEMRAATERRVAASNPAARIVTAAYDPAVGAALLAFDAADLRRPALAFHQ